MVKLYSLSFAFISHIGQAKKGSASGAEIAEFANGDLNSFRGV